MAFGILRTFLSRVKSLEILPQMPDLSPVLCQFQVNNNCYEHIEFEIYAEERPPMKNVPAYRDKFGNRP